MHRLLIMFGLLLLTGCAGSASPPLDPQLIESWAKALEAGDIAQAQTMMIDGSPRWKPTTEEALKKAPWKNHKILNLPADEKPYAPPGTMRVQWELQVPESEYYKLLCADVRQRDGKIEALNHTLFCNSSGKFESMLDPLLFEEGDIRGATLNTYGEYQTEKAIERGMPKPIVAASANAKRSPDEPLPTYFVHMHIFDPASAGQAFAWWQNQAPQTRQDTAGIGEQAFSVEDQMAIGISRSVTFTRCNAVVQLDAFVPANGLDIDLNAVKSAAERVDQRVKAVVCGKT